MSRDERRHALGSTWDAHAGLEEQGCPVAPGGDLRGEIDDEDLAGQDRELPRLGSCSMLRSSSCIAHRLDSRSLPLLIATAPHVYARRKSSASGDLQP